MSNLIFSITAPPTYDKKVNVGFTCLNDSKHFLGVQDDLKPTLFSVQKFANFMTISSQEIKNCKLIVARRVDDGNKYELVQSCVYNPNDISIFQSDRKTLVLHTPEGKLLSLGLDISTNCSVPHLCFMEKPTTAITGVEFTIYKENEVVPLPVPKVSSGLGAGWIVLLIFLGLVSLVLAFIYFTKPKTRIYKKQVYQKGDEGSTRNVYLTKKNN